MFPTDPLVVLGSSAAETATRLTSSFSVTHAKLNERAHAVLDSLTPHEAFERLLSEEVDVALTSRHRRRYKSN